MNKAVNVDTEKEEVTVINANDGAGGMLGDDLTEAELNYFRSGGQDVSGLMNDDNYKEEAKNTQLAQETPNPDPQSEYTYSETPPAAQPDPAIDRGQQPDPAAEAKPASDEVSGDEDIDFDNLRVGPDGRLRDPNGKFVPLKALQKERERFKAQRDSNSTLEAENRKLQENYARLSERINTLQELWTKPQDQAAQPAEPEKPKSIVEQVLADAGEAPDPETDVFAHAKWLADLNRKQFEAMRQLEQRLEQSTTEIREKDIAPVREQLSENEKINYYRQDASSFARENPSFSEAYRHLINQRHASLALTGFTDANQRMEQIQREERELVDLALSQNRRPAEFIYNYAVANGFRPAEPSANTNPAPAPAANQPAPAAPTPAPQNSEAAQRLINAQAAQNAAQTLSGSGGAAAETLTAEAIANMTDDQFLALHQKLGPNAMKTFLSGRN